MKTIMTVLAIVLGVWLLLYSIANVGRPEPVVFDPVTERERRTDGTVNEMARHCEALENKPVSELSINEIRTLQVCQAAREFGRNGESR